MTAFKFPFLPSGQTCSAPLQKLVD